MQTKWASFAEAFVNAAVGFIFAYVVQWVLVWAYNVNMNAMTIGWFTFWFTVVSIARSYIIRRFFNKHVCKTRRKD